MVTIEKYESSMAPEIWQVYFTAIRLICISDYSEAQVKAWASDKFDLTLFQEKLDYLNPFVASVQSKIVGYADLQADGLIDHFFVHGEHQSMGVGRALMNAILEKGRNKSKLYSNVSMTAKPFFQHYGFKIEKVQEVEIRGCKIKNNVMYLNQS